MTTGTYRGRLAPSPTGLLHVGHAATFWSAFQRAQQHGGELVFRNEDLDPQRSRPEFVRAMIEDLHWLGIRWSEGPDIGGPYPPYSQSERREFYLAAWRKLRDGGFIYPCTCSRRDLAQAAQAPHEPVVPDDPADEKEKAVEAKAENNPAGQLAGAQDSDDEPVYPGTCRCRLSEVRRYPEPQGVNWRFRTLEGEAVHFQDGRQGKQRYVCGRDFGDFVVWRRDDVPAYQLAVVVDDAAMCITEVVRGCDLLKSTARQLLLLRALALPVPDYYHTRLLRDENGQRLAKRHDALSLRHLRQCGRTPPEVLKMCGVERR